MTKRWYVVHAYSGFEKSVQRALTERIARAGMQDKFGQILVPVEEVVEMKSGQKSISERKFFPGYVLVEMDMGDDSWHLVKSTPKVTGFVVEPDLPISLANVRGDAFLAGVKKHEMDNEAHASALLDQFAALAAKAGVEFTPHHTTAYMIDHAIMEAAERTGCDMIVMVTHGRNALGEFIFGSHTKKIISQSQLPVLDLH